ncbi:MAG: zinc-binding dehydrogenase [Rhodospirillales bacterium]
MEEAAVPEPGAGEVRIKVLAAGTGFTDTMIRRGRYPDDAIGGAHFARSFACLASGGLLIGYGSQTMAVGGEGLAQAGLGLARLKLWRALRLLFRNRSGVFYSITARRRTHPYEFASDMATLFGLLHERAIHPVVIDRLGLGDAREVHARIDAGGFGGKIVLLPWRDG